MPLTFRYSLSRVVPVAGALLLAAVTALTPSARAADSLGAGGVVIPGSALAVGVAGSNTHAGAITARFSAVSSPLFWGVDTSNMNDGTAAIFALNTPSGLYSGQQAAPTDNAPFTQTSAPVLTGTGTNGDPYVVTSHFDATAVIHITQTITHVSGTTSFKATWTILNNGSPTNMQAFHGADMYVNGNDNGTGTIAGTAPNRVIGSVASDGTQGQLVEQAVSPWNHYFSGMNAPFYNSTGDSTYGYLPDTIDPTVQDSGEGVEWDITVPSNGTKTLSVVWNFTHPALPQSPRITGGAPTNGAATTATTANPTFSYAIGDAANSVAFQCAVDGGSFTACTSPKSLSGLADGSHTFSVRAINSAGDPGPQTDRTWTVDTTPPGTPILMGAPSGIVATDAAAIGIGGELGATFTCSVDGSSYVTCTSPLALTGLADGNHTVSVKQSDAAGNVSVTPASVSWTVDTSVPAAPAGLVAPSDSESSNASIPFTPLHGLTYECSLDGGAYVACTTPAVFTGLAVGPHTFKVRAVNAASTAGQPAIATWLVKATPTPQPPVDPTPTPEPPVSTPTPVPPVATPTPVPPKPSFTATVGGKDAGTSRSSAATVQVARQSVDVGCRMTGVKLDSCTVKLYAQAPTGKAAAAAQVLVGKGFVQAKASTGKLSVRVVLNATGRELLRRSPKALVVKVAISGKPVSGDPITATGSARLVAKRSSVTVGGFATDEATLSPAAKRALIKVAAKLRGGATVRVTGYTDSVGDDVRYLRQLALERAKAVRTFLAAHGANASYTLAGRGKSHPRATNATARGRALNRRVVLDIVG
jgi:outer membrane protein OmpA-like peptidoglycan-associated protein